MKVKELLCEESLPQKIIQVAENQGIRFVNEHKSFNPWDWWIKNAKKYDVNPCPPNEAMSVGDCYRNAIIQGMPSDAEYVEGFVVDRNGVAVKHAWNTIKGEAIDYTIGKQAKFNGWSYFGCVLNKELVKKAALSRVWMKSDGGVLSTLFFFTDKDLILWSKKL
jgi:hypothetical protein